MKNSSSLSNRQTILNFLKHHSKSLYSKIQNKKYRIKKIIKSNNTIQIIVQKIGNHKKRFQKSVVTLVILIHLSLNQLNQIESSQLNIVTSTAIPSIVKIRGGSSETGLTEDQTYLLKNYIVKRAILESEKNKSSLKSEIDKMCKNLKESGQLVDNSKYLSFNKRVTNLFNRFHQSVKSQFVNNYVNYDWPSLPKIKVVSYGYAFMVDPTISSVRVNTQLDAIRYSKEFLNEDSSVNIDKLYTKVQTLADRLVDPNVVPDFSCSKERLISLCTENGIITEKTAREALAALCAEMLGYVKNVQRAYYGEGVRGIDFIVTDAIGFTGITHLEIKVPASLEILQESIALGNTNYKTINQEAKGNAKKLEYQQQLWSDPSSLQQVLAKENKILDPTANLPATPESILGLIDLSDIPLLEEQEKYKSVFNHHSKEGYPHQFLLLGDLWDD